MFDRLRKYINPDELEIHIYNNGIYIVNYLSIDNFSDSCIKINSINKKLIINGNKLIISRLKKEELFISGDIKEVLFNE